MGDHEPGAKQNIKQFSSIEKIDTGILYALELTFSISVLLLAFGLIASMTNVLTKGSALNALPSPQDGQETSKGKRHSGSHRRE